MSKYNLKQDHENIKKQIKEWERELDKIVNRLNVVYNESTLGDLVSISNDIDDLSREMMSINM